jgi:hypothetical protein
VFAGKFRILEVLGRGAAVQTVEGADSADPEA